MARYVLYLDKAGRRGLEVRLGGLWRGFRRPAQSLALLGQDEARKKRLHTYLVLASFVRVMSHRQVKSD